LMLTGEFTSLEEPTDAFEVAAAVVFLVAPKFTGSERRTELRDPTQQLKLPIVISIS
jgi:hypothetical protein